MTITFMLWDCCKAQISSFIQIYFINCMGKKMLVLVIIAIRLTGKVGEKCEYL